MFELEAPCLSFLPLRVALRYRLGELVWGVGFRVEG